MSLYITVHDGCVDVADDSKWLNVTFKKWEYYYLRTDGAVISRVIEHILEKNFEITEEPFDESRRWCISFPVSGAHMSDQNAREDALQLVKWYKAQILNGNATINRALLFDRKPFLTGKPCCKNNVCDLIAHPEWYAKHANEDKTEGC
jgi:hypothetical protein